MPLPFSRALQGFLVVVLVLQVNAFPTTAVGVSNNTTSSLQVTGTSPPLDNDDFVPRPVKSQNASFPPMDNTTSQPQNSATSSKQLYDHPAKRDVQRADLRGYNHTPSVYTSHRYNGTGVTAWLQHGVLEPYTDWIKNDTTVLESGAIPFMQLFLQDYDTEDSHGCRRRRESAWNCFTRIYTGDAQFGCRIDQIGICKFPTPLVVMKHIDSYYSTPAMDGTQLSVEEKLDLARKVYFTIKSFESEMYNLHSLFSALGVVETRLLSRGEELIETFTQQPDATRVAQCELAKKMIQLCVDATISVVSYGAASFGLPELTDKLSSMVAVIDQGSVNAAKRVMEESSISMKEARRISPILKKNGKPATKHEIRMLDTIEYHKTRIIGELTTTMNSIKGFEAAGKAYKKSTHKKPEPAAEASPGNLKLTVTTSSGMCGSEYDVSNDDNHQRIKEVKNFMIKEVKEIRSSIVDHFDRLFSFNESAPDSSVLKELLSHKRTEANTKKATKAFRAMEEEVEQSMYNMLISQMLSASRCAMVCEKRPDAKKLCAQDQKLKGKRERTKTSRYCPNEDTRCQMECFTKASKYSHWEFVYGLASFDKWGFSAHELMEKSWKNYEAYGIKSYSHHNMYDGDLMSPDNTLHLHVHESKYFTIDDISKYDRGYPHHTNTWRRRTHFPYSTLDWRSTGEGAFLKAVQINVAEEKDMNHMNLWNHLRKNMLDRPASYFLNLCELNLNKYPKKPFRHPSLSNTTSALSPADASYYDHDTNSTTLCQDVLDQTTSMDEFQGSFHFCTGMPAVRTVFRTRRINHSGLTHKTSIKVNRVSDPDYGALCRRFLRHNKKEIIARGWQTDGSLQGHIDEVASDEHETALDNMVKEADEAQKKDEEAEYGGIEPEGEAGNEPHGNEAAGN